MSIEMSDRHLSQISTQGTEGGSFEDHYEFSLKMNRVSIIDGNVAFAEAMSREPPRAWSKRAIILYLACIVGFLCSTMNGYDGSLFNSLSQNQVFLDFFHGTNIGIWQGIVSAMYQIGGVVALPFVGPVIDGWGRKGGMVLGASSVIAGTVLQGTTMWTASLKQFIGGRFLVGFGVAVASAAGPMYVVEVSHPAHRGAITAFYNSFWFVGSILSSGCSRAADTMTGNITWLIPVWGQMIFSVFIMVLVWTLPESPRWLYVHDRQEEARLMLTNYHGNGNPNSIWVHLQIREYDEFLEMDGADKRWWDYRALFRDKASRYRLFCNCTIAIFGQWAGNAVLSYFLSAALDFTGHSGTIAQNNITLSNNCQQFFWAMLGSNLVDRVGRRPLLIFSNLGCCVVWIGMTVSTALLSKSGMKSEIDSKVSLAFIYIFNAVYAVGITPLQALYPVEVLSFEMRAKGMAFSALAVNVANLLNQFAWPVAMAAIGWRTYVIFVCWCAVQALVIYFFIPETKNRTLEELDEVFESRNPVRTSLALKSMAWDEYGDICSIREITD